MVLKSEKAVIGNVKCVVPENIHTPPTEGFWFASPHPLGISVPRGSLMTPPPPRNLHVTRTWFLL